LVEKETISEFKPSSLNRLGTESSPYLQMHAGNPVNWFPWGEEAMEKARSENKLLIISSGYAACHWCHVMENESFSNPVAASLMNLKFVSIKIDREERPDLDQVYMDAAMLLNGGGGWPLNVIALPDGRPVFAGTYFPREAWMSVLQQINSLYESEPERLVKHAEQVEHGIKQVDIIPENTLPEHLSLQNISQILEPMIAGYDTVLGGEKEQEIKFPMPAKYQMLLDYHVLTGSKTALDVVESALYGMARGGIHDHIGGGFARYSTDRYWKAPHFEKMLYDNGQLLSLFSRAYTVSAHQGRNP